MLLRTPSLQLRLHHLPFFSSSQSSAQTIFRLSFAISFFGSRKSENLCAALDNLWARFLPDPCGKCPRCLKLKRISRFQCPFTHAHTIRHYRESFNHFIRALQRFENIECWWQHEQNDIIARSP